LVRMNTHTNRGNNEAITWTTKVAKNIFLCHFCGLLSHETICCSCHWLFYIMIFPYVSNTRLSLCSFFTDFYNFPWRNDFYKSSKQKTNTPCVDVTVFRDDNEHTQFLCRFFWEYQEVISIYGISFSARTQI
jgi:hypothetical protein